MPTTAADAGLLQAIIAEPHEDVHRLVMADWLEENGQEERAEFVRVQCELASVEHEIDETLKQDLEPSSRRSLRARKGWLRDREDVLLTAHVEKWAPLAGKVWWSEKGGVCVGGTKDQPEQKSPHYSCTFRRGFVVEVADITCADWMRHGPAIVTVAPVERVRLSDKAPMNQPTALYHWFRKGSSLDEAPWVSDANNLPGELFDCFAVPDESNGGDIFTFRTAQGALDALSAGCLLLAKAHRG